MSTFEPIIRTRRQKLADAASAESTGTVSAPTAAPPAIEALSRKGATSRSTSKNKSKSSNGTPDAVDDKGSNPAVKAKKTQSAPPAAVNTPVESASTPAPAKGKARKAKKGSKAKATAKEDGTLATDQAMDVDRTPAAAPVQKGKPVKSGAVAPITREKAVEGSAGASTPSDAEWEHVEKQLTYADVVRSPPPSPKARSARALGPHPPSSPPAPTPEGSTPRSVRGGMNASPAVPSPSPRAGAASPIILNLGDDADEDEEEEEDEGSSASDDTSGSSTSDESRQSSESDTTSQSSFHASDASSNSVRRKRRASKAKRAARAKEARRLAKGKGRADDAMDVDPPNVTSDDMDIDTASPSHPPPPPAAQPAPTPPAPTPAVPTSTPTPYKRGPIPFETVREAEAESRRYITRMENIAAASQKPLSAVFRAAGWVLPDAGRTRGEHSANVYSRWYAATHPQVDPSKRASAALAEWREKMQELPENPKAEQIEAKFATQYTFYRDVQTRAKEAETIKDRENDLSHLLKELNQIATGIWLNHGMVLCGYLVDVEGTIGGSMAKGRCVGGGSPYEYMVTHHPGNYTKALTEVETIIRYAHLASLGLNAADGGDRPAPSAAAVYPERDWLPVVGKNPLDEYLRIVWECIRFDLGRYYRLSNTKLSSNSSNEWTPSQFPRKKWPDIAYMLGLCLCNWPSELGEWWPGPWQQFRKPKGRGVANVLKGMVERRAMFEKVANQTVMSEAELSEALAMSGAPGLMLLPSTCYIVPLVAAQEINPICSSVKLNADTEVKIFGTWALSERFRKDLADDTDSRIRWQEEGWGAYRNRSLIAFDEDED